MRIDVRPWVTATFVTALLLLLAREARGQPTDDAPRPAIAARSETGGLELSLGALGIVGDANTSLGFFVALGGRFDVIVDPTARDSERAIRKFRNAQKEADFDDDDALTKRRKPEKLGAHKDGEKAPDPPPSEAPRSGAPAKTDPATKPDAPANPDAPRDASPKASPAARAINGRMARGLVDAALRRDATEDHEDHLDSLDTRARASALLPEVRLRIGRDIDASETIAPTEYDPSRQTASGGTRLWVEGRATFQLDRLVFADDEIAIERLRIERERAERLTTTRVLDLVASWQSAELVLADPGLVDPDVRRRALAEQLRAEAELDVLTKGWFTAHKRDLVTL